MQYILTQAELDKLIDKKEVQKRDDALTFAFGLIVEKVEPPCVVPSAHHYYCDDCPLSGHGAASSYVRECYRLICKKPKHFSK